MNSQALQGIMVNSKEWNIEYLKELKEKFLDQGYPRKLIMEEIKKALDVDINDLLFDKNKKKKRTVFAPLVIAFSPVNPEFKDWIAE